MLLSPSDTANEQNPTNSTDTDKAPPTDEVDQISFFVELKLHHILAEVPESGIDINPALIRPVVAYLNAQPSMVRGRKSKTPPIQALFRIPLTEFDGAWTVYQTGFLDRMSKSLFESLEAMIRGRYLHYQRRSRRRRVLSTFQNSLTGAIGSGDEAEELGDGVSEEYDEDNVDSSPHGLRILSHVGWWSVRAASGWLYETWDALRSAKIEPPPDDEDDPFYDEVSRNV